MGKHTLSKFVQCPYYKCEAPQMIYCEGPEKGTTLHLAFNSRDKLKCYKDRKCESDYGSCHITKMLNRVWDYE